MYSFLIKNIPLYYKGLLAFITAGKPALPTRFCLFRVVILALEVMS